jgi:hypothetical protein
MLARCKEERKEIELDSSLDLDFDKVCVPKRQFAHATRTQRGGSQTRVLSACDCGQLIIKVKEVCFSLS